MANPIEAAAGAVKAPFTWATARPFVFGGFVVVLAVLAIKFAPQILGLIGKTPVVGNKVVKFAQPRTA